MEKTFHYHYQIGKAKHCISAHDGVQTHNDGSPFFGIEICKNLKKLKEVRDRLLKEGYKEN